MRSWGLSSVALLPLLFSTGCETECVGGNGQCGLTLTPRPPEVPVLWTSGMDAPVGTGLVFILDTFGVAAEGKGFDLDGRCRSPGDCVDNALHELGSLGNDQIRQGLLGGETLLIIEIAGLDVPIDQDDQDITIKFYAGRDADDPFFPANNFHVPRGETTCCEFEANGDALDGGEQPYIRIPARLNRGKLTSREPTTGAVKLTIKSSDSETREPIPVERLHITARVETSPTDRHGSRRSILRLEDVLLGGAIPSASLAMLDNPYCRTLNQLCPRQLPTSTMLDLVTTFLQPDVDLDGEPGLENLELGWSGRLERCVNERGEVVAPLRAGDPSSCIFQPEMGDGYSVALFGAGVEASVVGINYKD